MDIIYLSNEELSQEELVADVDLRKKDSLEERTALLKKNHIFFPV
jgi:hypothetical protein